MSVRRLARAVPGGDPAPPGVPTSDQLRAQARALLTGPASEAAWAGYRRQRAEGLEPDPRPLYAVLGAQGLLAPAWPVGYGGRDLTPHHQAAVVDVLVELGVAETLHTLSVQIAGTFLLTAATRAQRAVLLPALAAGRSYCSVLYSELEVGSDLAALATTATRDPAGGWRLSGRKVFSIKTSRADLALVAARTSAGSSRYQGITLFCVSLLGPGVRVGDLPSIADEQFADVEFDAVPVPDSAVIGPVGDAWPLITRALALERTGVEYHAKAARWLALWSEYASTVHSGPNGRGGPDPERAVEVARLEAAVEAARLFTDRCLSQLAGGRVDPVLAAASKLWCADTAREVAWWCTQESGPDALGRYPAGDPAATVLPGAGRIEAAYREAPGLTISAGTAEMMLELLAGSGLPVPGGDLAGLDEEPLARQLRAAVRAVAGGYDERDEIAPWWAELARLEVFGLAVPASAGGLGLGLPAAVVACEELGRGLLDAGVLDTLTTIDALCGTGGERVRDELAAALTGAYRAGLVDLRRGRAGRSGSAGPAGTGAAVAVPCLDGVDALLVLADDPALALHPARFDAVLPSCSDTPLRVPSLDLGGGWPLAADPVWLIERDRVRRAAWLVGLALGAVAEGVRRARTRHQFGKALIEHQSVAFLLARLTARVTAARLLVTAAAGGTGSATGGGPGAGGGAARALAVACELGYDATRQVMQLCGAYGMTSQAPAQRYYRAAMVAGGLAGPSRLLWRESAPGPTQGEPR